MAIIGILHHIELTPLYMSAAASTASDQEKPEPNTLPIALSFLEKLRYKLWSGLRYTYSFSSTASDMRKSLLLEKAVRPMPVGKQSHLPTFSYLGSQYTYPLLDPWTSLTTTSKPWKSRAVTASNPTSKSIKAHSKKA